MGLRAPRLRYDVLEDKESLKEIFDDATIGRILTKEAYLTDQKYRFSSCSLSEPARWKILWRDRLRKAKTVIMESGLVCLLPLNDVLQHRLHKEMLPVTSVTRKLSHLNTYFSPVLSSGSFRPILNGQCKPMP